MVLNKLSKVAYHKRKARKKAKTNPNLLLLKKFVIKLYTEIQCIQDNKDELKFAKSIIANKLYFCLIARFTDMLLARVV